MCLEEVDSLTDLIGTGEVETIEMTGMTIDEVIRETMTEDEMITVEGDKQK